VIFIDTGAFVARHLGRDQYHAAARKAWSLLRRHRYRLFTTNFVLDETFTLLARRAGHAFAAERARNILVAPSLTILRPDATDELEALAAFEKYADQEVSFTDCVSFVLMRKHGLRKAFSYDRHFALAGFEIWPGAEKPLFKPQRQKGSPPGQ
jgi:uncharacterized protein